MNSMRQELMRLYTMSSDIQLLSWFPVLVEEWPIERELGDCDRLSKKSTTDGCKGCKQPPLLKIPFQFVVVDTLNMFFTHYGTTVSSGEWVTKPTVTLIPSTPAHNSEVYSKQSQSNMCYLISQVIEAVVNKECEDVLTEEMSKIKVDLKFYKEFNQLCREVRKKVDSTRWENIITKCTGKVDWTSWG